MCGIAGFIGKSTNPEMSFDIITRLTRFIEMRGMDASGFWGANQDNIIHYKAPIPSSDLIDTEFWGELSVFNAELLLVHARGASSGVGSPWINSNNHPFVSKDLRSGLIHNGRIPDDELNHLTSFYEISSCCDSEVILSIINAQNDPLKGIRDVWSVIHQGHMSVAFGHLNNYKNLYLFRNEYRDLWVVDLRELLNQIFFVSTFQIWRFATVGLDIDNTNVIQLPPEEIWHFCLSENIDFKRLKVIKNNLTINKKSYTIING